MRYDILRGGGGALNQILVSSRSVTYTSRKYRVAGTNAREQHSETNYWARLVILL